MLKELIIAYDKHCVLYPAGAGIVLNFMFGPKIDPMASALAFGALGGFCWYVLKAIFITMDNVAHWPKDKPFFHDNAITAYDRTFAETIGKASREGKHND